MVMMFLIRLFVCYVMLRFSLGEETVQLNISQGALKGLETISKYYNTSFYSFKGIPYAKPNIGRNKFDVAKPLISWSGILDATKHGNACPHYCHIEENIIGDEDCLFLNVYTPDINENANKAVMVFIHGGGFLAGSGNDMLWGPDFLIEKDIVLVTMNYRLGVLGFLNTGNAHAPGNIGLKDQNLALKWVQENIMKFGGSPNRVTIFGQDAGAASVHYHMLSPMSQGLFKGAILQSGTAISPWAITYTPKENALMLAEYLGAKVSNTEELIDILKGATVQNLVSASREMILAGDMTTTFFVPSVETDVGQDIFLSDDPWKLITYGDIADVPVIIGLTADESGFMTEMIMIHATEYQNNLCKFIPNDLNVTEPKERKQIAQAFDEFYFNKKPINENSQAITELLSDSEYNHATLLSAGIMNTRMSSPVYEYLFNYFTSHGLLKQFIDVKHGIIHYDDLVFMFYSNYFNYIPESGSRDEEMINEIVEMWTNFAKDGDPSVTMTSAKIKWEPMGGDEKYLDIGNELVIKNSLFKSRIVFWAKLYLDVLDDYATLFV